MSVTHSPDVTTAWIFDMDGTLTHAVHDFEYIRRELGIAPGIPILEAIAAAPEEEARALTVRLDELELEFARLATAQPGAEALLEAVCRCGHSTGIVTRNSKPLAFETLDRAGLRGFFDDDDVLGRDCAAPKPSPDGINQLLGRWASTPAAALMVGDFRFDLDAARAANVTAVYYDPQGTGEWSALADRTVQRFDQLLDWLEPRSSASDA